jgi:WD40 repeat protein
VYCTYRVFDLTRSFAAAPGATYLARWSLPGGRRLSTTRIDAGRVLAARLTDSGRGLLVLDGQRVSTFDAGTGRLVRSVAIVPPIRAPSAAAIAPDGRTVALGSQTGAVAFVDARSGRARAGSGATRGPVGGLTYSPDGRIVAGTGNDNQVTVWDSRSARSTGALTAPAEGVQYVAFSPDARTLFTSSVGGVLLAWDLAGERHFGRRVAHWP